MPPGISSSPGGALTSSPQAIYTGADKLGDTETCARCGCWDGQRTDRSSRLQRSSLEPHGCMSVSEETVDRRGPGSGHPVDLSSAKPEQGAEEGGSRVGRVPRSWDSS